MATPTQVTVDDPHAVEPGGKPAPADAGGHGDIHGGEPHMMVGHDGQLHASNLQHFFVSSEQQFEASKLGMWLFLATEILLFGGMFVAYGIFRVLYPEVYEAASLQLDTVLGATNTLVLLLSSLTMAWAIRGAQMDNRKVLVWNLVATMALASGFLVVKYFEYSHKFHEGIYPGVNFQLADDTQRVNDLTGAVPATPLFVAPTHDEEHTEVEAEAGVMNVAPAPLAGADQSTPAGDRTAAPTSPAATGAGPDDGLDDQAPTLAETGVEPTGADPALATVAERDADPAGDQTQEGLETRHSGEVAIGPDKEAIFSQRRAGIFFSIYYVMTGIHAIHIVIGIIAIGFLTYFSMKGRYSSVWYTPVENVGLYWHIVDIIWIFVFPLMYLI